MNYDLSSPVAIGGVGGSGTRVVAEIIEQLGFFIGHDIDAAKDNLWFLLLFKRPRWYHLAQYDKNKIFTGLSLFTNSMFAKTRPTRSELKFLVQAVFETSILGHNYKGEGRGLWPFKRAWKMLTAKPKIRFKNAGWGWKEPNTHIFLEHLSDYFKNLKYIHTIRHGLDMAFSKNQQQLYNWGSMFGVALPKLKTEEPAASLKYWVKSNQRVLEFGERLGNERFLVVNFEKLCLSPKSEIQRIISFLNIKPNADKLKFAVNIPKKPSSLGRYRAHDTGQFESADLADLKTLGYSLTNTGP